MQKLNAPGETAAKISRLVPGTVPPMYLNTIMRRDKKVECMPHAVPKRLGMLRQKGLGIAVIGQTSSSNRGDLYRFSTALDLLMNLCGVSDIRIFETTFGLRSIEGSSTSVIVRERRNVAAASDDTELADFCFLRPQYHHQ